MARMYGDRPAIFSNASWHALKELASSATSEVQREKLEAGFSPASASTAPKSSALAAQLEFARHGWLWPDVHPLRPAGRRSTATGTLSGPAQLERRRLVAKRLI